MLQSMGSQRVGHDRSDLAAAAAEQRSQAERKETLVTQGAALSSGEGSRDPLC